MSFLNPSLRVIHIETPVVVYLNSRFAMFSFGITLCSICNTCAFFLFSRNLEMPLSRTPIPSHDTKSKASYLSYLVVMLAALSASLVRSVRRSLIHGI